MLTSACNMVCDFCGAEEGFTPLDPRLAWRLVQDLKARGCRSVVFGGGEPLLWPHDLRDLARRAKGLGLLTQIGSNAVKAAEHPEIWGAFDRWVLPLESADARVHDRLRRLEGGHHWRVEELMQGLLHLGIEVTVSTVVSARNFDSLLDLGQKLTHYQESGGRLHAWHLYRFLPQGRGGSIHGLAYNLDEPVYLEAASLVKSMFPKLPVMLRRDMYHSKSVGFYWGEREGLCAWEEGGEKRLYWKGN